MKSTAPDYIAKIEGHGSLNIDFSEGTAELGIHEGERLFEAIMVGRSYEDAVFIPQRICGVCPTAHNMASIKALEYALDVEVSKTTRDFRKLMLCGQIIQSHALHLFFLVLPDYMNIDSALALVEQDPEKFRTALNLKKIGDKIVEVVGGRPVHPITPSVGGFSKLPSEEELASLKKGLEMTINDAVDSLRLFASFKYPELERDTQYLSIQADNKYGFYGGLISTSRGEVFEIRDYRKHIDEVVKPYSTAKFGLHDKEELMVGALARVNLHPEYLNELAREELDSSGIVIPSHNSFHNNFAQAVEMLHFNEEAVKLIDTILDDGVGEHSQDVEVKAGVGAGAAEAPRGTLYYTYELDDRGRIQYCDIVTPTVQNLSNIEGDAEELLKTTRNKSQGERRRLLDMLVRAYDPCITCSVH
ncbi:MAG: Ni/Fe hydrogenase subunit alpha [Candidatus Altiarchaeota archaeon]